MRRLRYFLAVCDHGGISKAAEAMGIAQPALSRQVQLLEQEIGIDLFTRNGRGCLPTEAGVALRDTARGHLDGLDSLVLRLRRDYQPGPGRLTLGICPTIAPLFLDCVHDAVRLLPGLPDLSIVEAYSGDLRNLIQAGRLDLALTYGAATNDAAEVTPLFTERLVAVGRLPGQGPYALSDLPALPLILPSPIHQLRRIIDAACAARGLRLSPVLELDSLDAVRAMLAEGGDDHATILPGTAVAEDPVLAQLPQARIDDPLMVRQVALVCPLSSRQTLPASLLAAITSHAALIRQRMEATA